MRSETQFDPAALAGAALSAVLATMLVSGPFDWINLILGITILILLIAFVEGHQRSRLQSIALAAICAFCSLLVLGPILEVVLQAAGVQPDPDESRVPSEALFAIWVCLWPIWARLDRRVFCQRRLALPEWTRWLD
jgi:hypothetical protein